MVREVRYESARDLCAAETPGEDVSEGGLELLPTAKHLEVSLRPELRLSLPTDTQADPFRIQIPPNAPAAVSDGVSQAGSESS
jgi:hypothetical protein